MLKFWKSTLLVMLFANVLMAETIFDLSAQHFSNSIDGNGEGARYNLPKVYVSTPAEYDNGVYFEPSGGATSFMNIEIKNPLNTWTVSFAVKYALGYTSAQNTNHSIQFISDTGRALIFSIEQDKIHFNDNTYDTNIQGAEQIVGSLSKNGDQFILRINGIITRTYNISNFSKLKFIKFDLLRYYGSDVLSSINIGTSD